MMIMFSSNETPAGEFKYCNDLMRIINLDDITMIDYSGSRMWNS